MHHRSKPLKVDILSVGHASFDLVMMVDHHPTEDEKCLAYNLISCGGGPAANAAVAARRLGGTSAFAGYLGEDLYGSEHLAELQWEGVETELIVRGTHPTPLSVILVKPGGLSTVVTHKAETPPLENEIDLALIHPKVILFDGHEPLIAAPLAKEAKKRGIPTILDAGSPHRGAKELALVVDYLIASEKFARGFTGEEDPVLAVEKLGDTAPFAAVTLGMKGLVWKRKGKMGSMAAFQVEPVDTTGAGDAFHGAFALAIARKQDPPGAMKFASAVAALCCTKAGARPGIPNAHEVRDFLAEVD